MGGTVTGSLLTLCKLENNPSVSSPISLASTALSIVPAAALSIMVGSSTLTWGVGSAPTPVCSSAKERISFRPSDMFSAPGYPLQVSTNEFSGACSSSVTFPDSLTGERTGRSTLGHDTM